MFALGCVLWCCGVQLDSACQQLAQVLTGANAEVSLGIRQRVEQLVNDPQHQQFACVTIQQIREQEKEQQETVVEAGALSKEEFAELVSTCFCFFFVAKCFESGDGCECDRDCVSIV